MSVVGHRGRRCSPVRSTFECFKSPGAFKEGVNAGGRFAGVSAVPVVGGRVETLERWIRRWARYARILAHTTGAGAPTSQNILSGRLTKNGRAAAHTGAFTVKNVSPPMGTRRGTRTRERATSVV